MTKHPTRQRALPKRSPAPPPQDRPDIYIFPGQWQLVRYILQLHVPADEVWAFGSRARRRAKPYSDLDLAIITQAPLPLDTRAALSSEFSESDLPWKVDVVDWSVTNDTFREIIRRERVVLCTPPRSSAPAV